MRQFAAMAAAALAISSVTPATAQPYDAMGDAGGWNVFYNQATGGCFMERKTEQDIVLQIGTEAALLGEGPSDSYGFLAIYVPGEAPEVTSDTPLVLVDIGPNSYVGSAHRVVRDGYHGGYVVSSGDNDLGWDLQNRRAMTITTSNGAIIEVDLLRSDIEAGVELTKECQRKNS